MIDLENMTQEQWNEGVGKVSPGAPTTTSAPPTTTTPEVPRETQPAAEAAPQPTGERPRNPDGTFAPVARGDAAGTTEPAAPREPFAGFSKLPPEVQTEFNRLYGERDDFKLRYTRLNGEYRRVAARQQPGSGRESQPVQQQPRSGATQVGQAAQDARQGAQAIQPG